jgi:hypothetical protein
LAIAARFSSTNYGSHQRDSLRATFFCSGHIRPAQQELCLWLLVYTRTIVAHGATKQENEPDVRG